MKQSHFFPGAAARGQQAFEGTVSLTCRPAQSPCPGRAVQPLPPAAGSLPPDGRLCPLCLLSETQGLVRYSPSDRRENAAPVPWRSEPRGWRAEAAWRGVGGGVEWRGRRRGMAWWCRGLLGPLTGSQTVGCECLLCRWVTDDSETGSLTPPARLSPRAERDVVPVSVLSAGMMLEARAGCWWHCSARGQFPSHSQ